MLLTLAGTGLVVRADHLQVLRKDFYREQGDARPSARSADPCVARHRARPQRRAAGRVDAGRIHLGQPAGNPAALRTHSGTRGGARHAVDEAVLRQKLDQRADKEFLYLKRHLNPDDAKRDHRAQDPRRAVRSANSAAIYPSGEVMAHVLGFTNIDDRGQEGLELAFDEWLARQTRRRSA